MFQEPLPEEYAKLTPEQADLRIRAAKARLGKRLVILGHHYQRDEIIAHADYRGDSYKLAKDAARNPEAEFIVFCGVHFMAESADILTPDTQKVILPNLAAGCSMADMANGFQVKKCWRELEETLSLAPVGAGAARTASGDGGLPMPKVVPITYINSSAAIKAFVGERGGVVCTSSNAPRAVRWALEQGSKALFLPDQHLGRNTGVKLGFDPETEMCLWDPFKPLGGNGRPVLVRSTFILWKGHCSVHKRFTVEQIEAARAKFPEIQVVVHPECELEVVKAADLNGSTEYIIRQIEESPAGTVWAVGTEINLVSRLARENPDKTVFCLDPQICPCSTMYRIHPSFLCWTLENLAEGRLVNQVTVPPQIKAGAKLALDRMLALP